MRSLPSTAVPLGQRVVVVLLVVIVRTSVGCQTNKASSDSGMVNGTSGDDDGPTPELDPSVPVQVARLLVDANNDTCLKLADANMYAFSPATNQWLPPPEKNCWRSGLIIKIRMPEEMTSSFTVSITGRHLTCSKSHVTVMVRHTMTSECVEAGSVCALGIPPGGDSASLTTCVATCSCTGNDCKFITIYIPRKHNKWELCEIE